MLLQRLSEYAERIDLPPSLYASSPVRYIIELDGGGRLLTPVPIDTADPASRETKYGQRRLVPQIQRSSAVRPLLLADKADYTFGLAREEGKGERAARCHEAYLDLLGRCVHATGEPSVAAVHAFLLAEPLRRLDLPADFDPGALITFRVDGVLPVDLPAVQAFWAQTNDPEAEGASPRLMQCLVCGRERAVLPRLLGKIKGIPGGQTSGTAIISANAEAFESYGLEKSLVAPTCAVCGERFTKAANALLADRSSRTTVGNTAFIFWTREPVAFSFLDYLDRPQPEQVRDLLTSVRRGIPPPEVDATAFYAAALSASGGRAVVRDWIDTTVGGAKHNLAHWFERQAIADARGGSPTPLRLYALAAATVRDPAKELAPPTPRALLRSALTGSPLPWDLLYQAVRRNRAEQGVDRPRAALIKLVLRSHQPNSKEDAMIQLNSQNQSPAYRCGRLLAVLEAAQRLAIPGAKATIVDRFFGTASSAPASVFGRLLRGAQPHLAKLKRDRPGAHIALQRRLEEIQSGLQGFPRVLTLQDQGLFALGYYHQRAFDRAAASEARVRREAGKADESDAALGEALAAEELLAGRKEESEERE